MSATIRIVVDKTPETMASIRQGLSDGIMAIAEAIEADAKRRIMEGPKTGRIYRRSGVTRSGGKRNTKKYAGLNLKRDNNDRLIVAYKIHQASASGQAPANDQGALANSIQTERESQFEVDVVVGEGYGEVLENERNRPFLGPAMDAVESRAEGIVRDAIDARIP